MNFPILTSLRHWNETNHPILDIMRKNTRAFCEDAGEISLSWLSRRGLREDSPKRTEVQSVSNVYETIDSPREIVSMLAESSKQFQNSPNKIAKVKLKFFK